MAGAERQRLRGKLLLCNSRDEIGFKRMRQYSRYGNYGLRGSKHELYLVHMYSRRLNLPENGEDGMKPVRLEASSFVSPARSGREDAISRTQFREGHHLGSTALNAALGLVPPSFILRTAQNSPSRDALLKSFAQRFHVSDDERARRLEVGQEQAQLFADRQAAMDPELRLKAHRALLEEITTDF